MVADTMEESHMHGTKTRLGIGLVGTAALMAATLGTGATAQSPSPAPVTLSYLVDNSQDSTDRAQALANAYMALHPNVTILIEQRPGGAEGDNLVKTRLATGDMNDIFFYNSGSLLQALHPADTLVDLSKEAFIANIAESFLPTVSQGTGIYGVPTGTALGGGILYNKKVFEANGLKVPTTWAEFEANNDALKAAGVAPVGQTYKDTWTSQLFVLADYYNVQAAVPDFADQYTGNKLKTATTPAALAGFQHLQEGFDKGWWQQDFGSATYDDGMNMLAAGEIAQYPMLSFALATINANHPDQAKDIGFFAQPGTDAATNGATIWMPAGTYIPKTTEAKGADTIAAAKDFLAFIASPAGSDAQSAASAPAGPYLIKDSALPADTLPGVRDILAYIDANKAYPALEFVSPLKGPNLEQITVAVGSGLTSAADGAAQYDQDLEKQAKQLNLPGW
jgi:raffinose/stachyose/melibiose transport system substrate-binding protein